MLGETGPMQVEVREQVTGRRDRHGVLGNNVANSISAM